MARLFPEATICELPELEDEIEMLAQMEKSLSSATSDYDRDQLIAAINLQERRVRHLQKQRQ